MSATECSPSSSAANDAGLIACVRRLCRDRSQLCVRDLQRVSFRCLVFDPPIQRVWGPALCPDGRQLCCVGQQGDRSVLFLLSLNGSPQRQLTTPAQADDDAPAWSPDAARITFARGNQGGPDHIHLLDVASGEVCTLTSGSGLDGAPSWSPDGRWIVFHRALADPAGLYVVPAGGGSAQFLTPGKTPDWSPDPDGSLIAYAQGGLLWAIHVRDGVEADGLPRQFTRDPRVVDRHPSWSPAGRGLVFSREVANGHLQPPHLIVLVLASGEEQDIGEGQEPDWGPSCASSGS